MSDSFGRKTVLLFALLGLLPLTGCSGGKLAKVTGKVTYQGKPVPSGTVTFVGAEDRVESTEIQEDGSYTIPQAPVGPVKIGVRTYEPWSPPTQSQLPGQAPQAPPAKKPYVKLPDAYRNPETSGLTYDVQPGVQTHNLDLK